MSALNRTTLGIEEKSLLDKTYLPGCDLIGSMLPTGKPERLMRGLVGGKDKWKEIEAMVGELPLFKDACSEARRRWLAAAARKEQEASKAKAALHPMTTKSTAERRDAIVQIIENAANKMQNETRARQAKLDEAAKKRKEDLIFQAGIEYLWETFGGKKSKPMSDTLQDKLSKACKCSKVMACGYHKEECSAIPSA